MPFSCITVSNYSRIIILTYDVHRKKKPYLITLQSQALCLSVVLQYQAIHGLLFLLMKTMSDYVTKSSFVPFSCITVSSYLRIIILTYENHVWLRYKVKLCAFQLYYSIQLFMDYYSYWWCTQKEETRSVLFYFNLTYIKHCHYAQGEMKMAERGASHLALAIASTFIAWKKTESELLLMKGGSVRHQYLLDKDINIYWTVLDQHLQQARQ